MHALPAHSCWYADRPCAQVPELRAACKSLGIKSTGESWQSFLYHAPCTPADGASAGAKAELTVSLLARFGLTSPASASHRLITHHKLHDVILAGWAMELSLFARTTGSSTCRAMVLTLKDYHTIHRYFAAQQCCHPMHGNWQSSPTRRIKPAGRAVLAGRFGSWALLQQAVVQQRLAYANALTGS